MEEDEDEAQAGYAPRVDTNLSSHHLRRAERPQVGTTYRHQAHRPRASQFHHDLRTVPQPQQGTGKRSSGLGVAQKGPRGWDRSVVTWVTHAVR